MGADLAMSAENVAPFPPEGEAVAHVSACFGGEGWRLRRPMTTSLIRADVTEAIGDTPLIRLRRASEATGCEILGKAEFLNPGQSVKDRAALYIIRDAERRGSLRPGGRDLVEGTAGNTGIGASPWWPRRWATRPPSSSPAPRARGEEGRPSGWQARPWWRWTRSPIPTLDNYVKYSGRLAEELARTEAGRLPSGRISSTTSPTARRTSRPPARRSGRRPAARSTASSAR